ncbi:hypothetical protein AB0G15_05295 [Streptosporangium sp. NPDC023825]|uniref:hypothetical protein n=1 Tax=Streptosporangium sp. NPDC023825 TaxID=3154909 RepID=UPI00341D7555
MTIQIGTNQTHQTSDLCDVKDLIGQNPAYLEKIRYSDRELEEGWVISRQKTLYKAVRLSPPTHAEKDAGLYPTILATTLAEFRLQLQLQLEKRRAFEERMAIMAGVPWQAPPPCI